MNEFALAILFYFILLDNKYLSAVLSHSNFFFCKLRFSDFIVIILFCYSNVNLPKCK